MGSFKSKIVILAALVAAGCEYREEAEIGDQELGEPRLGDEELGERELGEEPLGERQLGDQELGRQPGEPGYQPGQQPGQQQPGQQGMQQQPGQQGMQQQPGQQGQQLGQQQPQTGQQPMGKDQLGQQQPMVQQQTAMGRIQEVDQAAGELTLQTDQGQELELHARPMDLGQVAQGDQLQVQYASYNGENWVVPSPDAAQNLRAWGTPQTLTGTVENIDQQEGKLTVNGQEIRVHPSMLQQVRENQNLRVEYVSVDGTNWASQVQPVSGGLQGT